MCLTFDVSRSGYYDWKKQIPSRRARENEAILAIMKKSYTACQCMCGLDKMLEDVREKYPGCGRNRIYRLQKEHGLYSVRKKPYRGCTTDSNHSLPVADNLLDRNFDIAMINSAWVSDITQVQTAEGKAYLTIVKDLADKEIVGWCLESHMRTELCLTALDRAVKKRRPQKD